MAAIAGEGGEAIHFPALEIQPLSTAPAAAPDMAIFISANAVEQGLGRVERKPGTRMVAIGRATARALENAGVKVAIEPPSPYTTETLLALPAMAHVEGLDVLIVRGEGGRERLRQVLEQRGARVRYLECYRRVMPEADVGRVLCTDGRACFDATLCTSVEGLRNIRRMFGPDHEKLLLSLPVVVVSDRMHGEARKSGFRRVIRAENASPEAVVAALKTMPDAPV